MANLSQEKRHRMLAFLDTIKEEHKDDDEVIKALNEIETELTAKKYGLIWEEHEENVDIKMKTQVPVWIDVSEKEITAAPGEPYHFLLEGDNLHSLRLLEKTHRGRIDVIYIDPPYNTGNNDFTYNDEFIDSEDKFRHSKWLSFMEKRLKIAYRLLSDDGLFFVSIDDNEQSALKLLLDEIFSERNFVITLPRITKKSGKTTGSFSKNHDYVLVYTKRNQDIFVMEEHVDSAFCNEDEWVEERGKYKLNQTLDYDSLSYSASLDYALEIEGEVFYPGTDQAAWETRQAGDHRRADWAWRWNKKLFEFGYNNGFVVIKRKNDGTARIYTKTYLNAKIEKNSSTGEYCIEYKKRTKPLSSIGLIENEYSNDNAKKDLDVFGLKDDFDYSKPVELIKRLLKNHYNRDAVVLDFFAGSGTTAQAVLELNAEDGGQRRFILCTNNQNKICEEITYKRCHDLIFNYNFNKTASTVLYEHKLSLQDLKNAGELLKEIEGIRKENEGVYPKFKTEIKNDCLRLLGLTHLKEMQGMKANMKYYKTGWVPKSADGLLGDELLKHMEEMICLEQASDINNGSCFLLLSDEDADRLEAEWQRYTDCRMLYISKDVLLTSSQEKLFADAQINMIPEYYFMSELREAGEIW